MLIVCDFDGTVTVEDTLDYLVERFAPGVLETIEQRLFDGPLSLREVLEIEVQAIDRTHDDVVAAAVEHSRFRPGFAQLVDAVRARGDRFVVVSAGFRSLIEPMLAHHGIDPDGIEVIANDAGFDAHGDGMVTFRAGTLCAECGEHCKRHDLVELESHTHDDVVYIGDGYSDRCAAQTADRIFARARLADYLAQHSVAFEPFEDFTDVLSVVGAPHGAE